MKINRVGVDLAKMFSSYMVPITKAKPCGSDSYPGPNGYRFYAIRLSPELKSVWKPVPVPTTGPGS